MIQPTRRTAVLALLFAAPLALYRVFPQAAVIAALGDCVLFFLYLLERRKLLGAGITLVPGPTRRTMAGQPARLIYTVVNPDAKPLVLAIRQPLPPGWQSEGTEALLTAPPSSRTQVEFVAFTAARGEYQFPPPELTITGASGLFRRVWRNSGSIAALIYPSLDHIGQMERMRRGGGMAARGQHRHRQVGTGSDFERLRTYQPDDDFRHINWKNTARHGKPVTNVYQSEKGRDVLLCIDAGRMMGQRVAGELLLDQAVETGMALARAVEREGDRIGVVVFRDKVDDYILPRGGKTGLRRATDSISRLAAKPVHTAFAALAAAIGARQTRRALVIVFTNLNDPQGVEDLAAAMRLIRGRHAGLVISRRDPALERIAAAPALDRTAMCRSLAAGRLAEERDAAGLALRRLGVEAVECSSTGMATMAIDRYLHMKASRRIE